MRSGLINSLASFGSLAALATFVSARRIHSKAALRGEPAQVVIYLGTRRPGDGTICCGAKIFVSRVFGGPLTDPRRVKEYLCSALLSPPATHPEANFPRPGGPPPPPPPCPTLRRQ